MAARSTSSKSATRKSPAKKSSPAKKNATTAKKTTAKKATSSTSTKTASPARPSNAKEPAAMTSHTVELPAPRGTTKDGISYTKDFTVKFLTQQKTALLAERDRLLGQAARLEDEAKALIEDGEMGDVQFDDESGEGDTMVVEREHDLAMSAEARQTVIEIDAALQRLADGSYGYSVVSGQPIPEARLDALPWATVLVEEKVGGIGRR